MIREGGGGFFIEDHNNSRDCKRFLSGGDFSSGFQSNISATLLDVFPLLLAAARLKPKTALDAISLIDFKDIDFNRPIISQYHAEHINSSALMIVVSLRVRTRPLSPD